MNDSIRTQIEALHDMRLPELQARYAEVLGEETRAPNRTFLIRRITEALEAAGEAAPADEQCYGAHSQRALSPDHPALCVGLADRGTAPAAPMSAIERGMRRG